MGNGKIKVIGKVSGNMKNKLGKVSLEKKGLKSMSQWWIDGNEVTVTVTVLKVPIGKGKTCVLGSIRYLI